jgi:predicted DCC family thiol-disulfide oxidoreductase YuxK
VGESTHANVMNPSTAPPPRRSLLAPRVRLGARQLVLYDGACGLCAKSVQFLLDRDRAGALVFAPLQGETAAELIAQHHLPGDLETIIFVRDQGTPDETPFLRSDAALEALAAIGRGWRLAALLRVVPRPLRDGVYRWVAHHRYGWFGRADACRLPAPEVRARFLP